MNPRPEVTGRKYISKRGVATRYGIVTRTVDRWTEKGVLPPADLVINTRAYWDEAGLDAHDRARTVEAGAKGAKRLAAQPPNSLAPAP